MVNTEITRNLTEPIENALRPFFAWIDNDRIYDQPELKPDFLERFQREQGNSSLLLLIVLKNILLLSTEEADSPTLLSDGCNRYISTLLSKPMNLGTKNIFNLFLANTTGKFNGITDENKEAMRAYVRSGGKRKSKRKCKKSKRSRIKCFK
jgi:hypothetical protein